MKRIAYSILGLKDETSSLSVFAVWSQRPSKSTCTDRSCHFTGGPGGRGERETGPRSGFFVFSVERRGVTEDALPPEPIRKDWDQKHLCTLWWPRTHYLSLYEIVYILNMNQLCSTGYGGKWAKCKTLRECLAFFSKRLQRFLLCLSFFFQALPVCSLKSHFLILYFCDNRDLLSPPLRVKKKEKKIKHSLYFLTSLCIMYVYSLS